MFQRSKLGLLLAAGILLPLKSPAFAVTTRFEAESTGAIKDQGDAVGYDSINGVVLRAADVNASNGELLATSATNRNFKIIFVGTGINLISRLQTNGANFNWILDEGAQTGMGMTVAGATVNQASVPIVSGLANTLHTLEIRHDGTPATGLRVDAFDVLDAGSQTRYEENGGQITYNPAANWTLGYTAADSAAEGSGGSIGYSLTSGDTATLNFSGTAVAVIASARADASPFDFNIDNGAITGTINVKAANALNFGFWHRWPFLLANNLAPGAHTLTLTSRIVGGGAANFDAIDVFGIPEASSLSLMASAVAGLTARRRRQGANISG